MSKFVAAFSDDEEVVVVPFVKPTPPLVVLSGSEDEDDTAQGQGKDSDTVPSVNVTGQNEEKGGPSLVTDVTPSNNLFHPSESALMDTSSKNSTPVGSVETTPVPSPTAPAPKKKGRHSNLVKQQFASFLKGINLPPPPQVRRRTSKSPRTSVSERSGENDVSSTLANEEGFVSVTQEKSPSKRTKKKKVSSAPVSSFPSPVSMPAAEAELPSVADGSVSPVLMDIQFNRTTLDKQDKPRTKRSRSSDKEPQKSKKKKKDDERLETSARSKSKPKSKSDPSRHTSTVPSQGITKSQASKSPQTPDSVKYPLSARSPSPVRVNVNDAGMPRHWTDEMKRFYGHISTKQFKLNVILAKMPDNGRHWKTIAKDRGGSSNRNRRREPCDICGRYEHRSFNCPQRGVITKCLFCSSPRHTKDACSEGICLFCGSPRGAVVKTCHKCLDRQPMLKCSQCEVLGHSLDMCPDNWRRYHTTTFDVEQAKEQLTEMKSRLKRKRKQLRESEESEIRESAKKEIELLEISVEDLANKIGCTVHWRTPNPYVQKSKLYCSNCATKGHSHFNCTKAPPPWWGRGQRVIFSNPHVINELYSSGRPAATTLVSSSASASSVTSHDEIKDKLKKVKKSGSALSPASVTTGAIVVNNGKSQSKEALNKSVINSGAQNITGSHSATKVTTGPESVSVGGKTQVPTTEGPQLAKRSRVNQEAPNDFVQVNKMTLRTVQPSEALHAGEQNSRVAPESDGRDRMVTTAALNGGGSRVSSLNVTIRNEDLAQGNQRFPLQDSSSSQQPDSTSRPAVPNPTDRFFEDVLPNSFDAPAVAPQPLLSIHFPPPPVHPLFSRPPPKVIHPLFSHPPPPFDAHIRNAPNVPPPLYVHVPVPIPVRDEDFARFQAEGFPPNFSFQQYYSSFQQIPPTQFQAQNVDLTANDDNPPSPDSTEIPASDSAEEVPISAPPSPEIVFLGEVVKPRESGGGLNNKVTTKDGAVAGPSNDEWKIGLLSSEWDLFVRDKGKSDLIDMLSAELGVTIKICKDTMSITIQGEDESTKAITKRNLVEFLQKEAAGIKFVPNLEPTGSPAVVDKNQQESTVKQGSKTLPNSPKAPNTNVHNFNAQRGQGQRQRQQGQNRNYHPLHHRYNEGIRNRPYEEYNRRESNYPRNDFYRQPHYPQPSNQDRYRENHREERDYSYARNYRVHRVDNSRREERPRHYQPYPNRARRYFDT